MIESFNIWLETRTQLHINLLNLRPQMALAAQSIYNAWDQDEDFDDYNGGGICQDIAEAITEVIDKNIPGVNAGSVSSSCGENHVFVMLYMGEEGFLVDIPYSEYETGAGYKWSKLPNVKFTASSILIEPVSKWDAQQALESPF